MNHVAQRARHLGSGGTGSDQDEVERALGNQRRIAIGRFQDGKNSRAQQLGVV